MTIKLVLATLTVGSVLALTAASAMAAPPPPPPGPPPPNFHFGINIGPPGPPPGPPPDSQDCSSTRQIMRELRGMGYSNFVNFDDSDDSTFTVDAQRGYRWYELDVDNCTGDIVDRSRIRPPHM